MHKTIRRTLASLCAAGMALALNHPALAADSDDNPPGPIGGPGTNWENPPGPRGGPGASPNYRPPVIVAPVPRPGAYYGRPHPRRNLAAPYRPYRWDRDNNPPGPRGGRGTNWDNPPGPRGGPGASPNRRYR